MDYLYISSCYDSMGQRLGRKDCISILHYTSIRCIPSGVIRKKGAPNATISVYLFRLALYYATISNIFMHALREVLLLFTWPASSIFDTVFTKVNRGPPTSLTAHFSTCFTFVILSPHIRSTCPNLLSTILKMTAV